MYNECEYLETIPELSKWKTNNIKDINCLFRCYVS